MFTKGDAPTGMEMMVARVLKAAGIDPAVVGNLATVLQEALTKGLADNREIIARQRRLERMLEDVMLAQGLTAPPIVRTEDVRSARESGSSGDGNHIDGEFTAVA